MSISHLWLSSSLILCAALVGCGGAKDPNRQATKPISVTVTYKGSAVEGATVSFIPEAKGSAPAFGRTDAQGVAKMKTYEEGDGATLGKHKVTITKSETTGGPPAVDQDSPNYVPPELSNAPPPTITNHIPVKYGMPGNGLVADVSDSNPPEIKFELTD